MAKLIWRNLKDKPSTVTAVCSIASWVLNAYCKFIPQDAAAGIIVLVNAVASAAFFTTGKKEA